MSVLLVMIYIGGLNAFADANEGLLPTLLWPATLTRRLVYRALASQEGDAIPETLRRYGVAVTAVLILKQIAENLEQHGSVEIRGNAADDTLMWLRALRDALAEVDA